jgi:hypothetical protein
MHMGNAGKKTVIAEFSPDEVADRLLHVYKGMIADKRRKKQESLSRT